ncbi:phage minor head protein [Methylobacterium aquaticum]|uniref:phage head morphogenesis protein n=1 Tax=Methylobacterium aquaticum TaxID=270351 RepID=UPI003D178C23
MAEPQARRGFTTPPEVTSYFADKGLRPSFSIQDVTAEEHAYAFMVSKATELELLTSFKTSIDRALATGQGLDTWRRDVTDELRRIGWAGPRTVTDPTGQWSPVEVDFTDPRRLATIFWSNVNSARSAGQWERAQRTKAALPYALYVPTASTDPRKEHLGWVGTILPIDHPWWATHWPPNGWGCKCGVRMITARERDRLLALEPKPGGIRYTEEVPDDGPPRVFTNARTGEVSEVPAGIDPGWQTNPGLSRARTLVTRLRERLAEAGEEDARAAIAAINASPTPRVLTGLPETVFLPVAVAPPKLATELGGVARIVEVSNTTMRAKIEKHGGSRPVTPEAWNKVQEVVDTGTIVDEGRPGAVRHRSVFAELDDGLWQLVVKAADRGRYFLVSSFHAAKSRDFEDALRRERKARGEG